MKIKLGDKLTFCLYAGRRIDWLTGKIKEEWTERTGKVVLSNCDGTFLVNIGEPSPILATSANIVAINGKRI